MKRSSLCIAVAVLFISATTGYASTHRPGLPGVAGGPQSSAGSNPGAPPAAPLPQPLLLSVSPDSAPPGGSGELTLIGRNLVKGVNLRIGCANSTMVHIESFTIESPDRAVAHVAFPEDVPEGACDFYLEYSVGPTQDILPTIEGTREVVQEKAVSFKIAKNSTGMAIGLGEYVLIPEAYLEALTSMSSAQADAQKMAADIQSGKLNPMDPAVMKKMQEAAMVMAKMVQQGPAPKNNHAGRALA